MQIQGKGKMRRSSERYNLSNMSTPLRNTGLPVPRVCKNLSLEVGRLIEIDEGSRNAREIAD